MRRPQRLIWLTLVFVTAGVGDSTGVADARQARPNVLIVMTDDQGLGDFSFTGNPVLKTPHLDAFARESVRLTDFHVCPMCSPTRGQLMTGLTSLRNGVTSVTAGRTFLRPGIPTLPELFAKAGYKTGLFGKWHLGDSYPHRPIDKGFQESIYHLGWGQLHSTPEFDWPLIDGRYFQNGVEKRYRGHCTDVWFDAAMEWMKSCRERNEPFLCYLPTNAPHAPHIDLDHFIEPYQGQGPAGFFGMIAHIDQRFGDLDQFLTEQKLRDNTIVIFMTDNGGTAGVRLFNAGLRGGKTTYYDGGHRVPCWIRWPNGKLGEPRDIDVPTQNTDLLPTLCEFCGVEPPQWRPSDNLYRGDSLASLLRGVPDAAEKLADRTLVVQYGQIPKKFESCVVRGRWRLVKGTELYDVVADRAQTTDLAAKHPDIVLALRQYYEVWWQGLEPTLHDFVPLSLGAAQQPIVELTSGDWEGIYADNTGFVREAVGGPTGGHWHVFIEHPGDYEFTLRRWPEQTGAALGDRYEFSDKSPPNKPNVKIAAFPSIAKAKLEIAGVQLSTAVSSKTTAATIVARNLPSCRTTLKAWFTDAEGQDLCGAFFVTVKRLSRNPL
jgi:arylsulfatase